MMLSKRTLYTSALFYLFVPLAIFLIGWVNLWFSIPLVVVGLASVFCIFRTVSGDIKFGPVRKEIIILAMLAVWTIGSGIGGFVWQNSWDHSFRNAVFSDLINEPWPIIENHSILTYYIGFWLPSAFLAKICGSVFLGNVLLLIYAFLGIYIAFRIYIDLIGPIKLRYLLIFMLFSGMDIVGYFIYNTHFRYDYHIEIWSPLCYWESNTTLLYWVYNQAIPAWVATALLFSQWRRKGVVVVTLVCLFISAPFSVVGLSVLGLYYMVRGMMDRENIRSKIKYFINWHNVTAIISVVPVILFFQLNDSTVIRFYISVPKICHVLVLVFFEIGVFMPFIFSRIKRSPEFWILFFTSLLCLFILMGDSNDFNSRVELPLSFLMILELAYFVKGWKYVGKIKKSVFILVCAFCVVTPIIEIGRTGYNTIRLPKEEYRADEYSTIFDIEECRWNFISDKADLDGLSWLFKFEGQ